MHFIALRAGAVTFIFTLSEMMQAYHPQRQSDEFYLCFATFDASFSTLRAIEVKALLQKVAKAGKSCKSLPTNVAT